MCRSRRTSKTGTSLTAKYGQLLEKNNYADCYCHRPMITSDVKSDYKVQTLQHPEVTDILRDVECHLAIPESPSTDMSCQFILAENSVTSHSARIVTNWH